MSAAVELERSYRRWLRCYPGWFRREHEADMLGVLLAEPREGQSHPEPGECWDLFRAALGARLRPRIARSQRSAWAAVRLMYLGAVAQGGGRGSRPRHN